MSLNGVSSQICPGMAKPCEISATVTKFTHHEAVGLWPYKNRSILVLYSCAFFVSRPSCAFTFCYRAI